MDAHAAERARREFDQDITKVASTLIDAGADPRIKSREGHTALIYAVSWNKAEIVRMFLDNLDMDVNEKDEVCGWSSGGVLACIPFSAPPTGRRYVSDDCRGSQ